jgi:hypothetical protein
MRRTMLAMIGLLAGLLLLGTTAQAQEAKGTVTNRDGVARSGCQVTFTGPASYTVRTNSSGAFSLQGPVDGTYKVVVTQGQLIQEFRVAVSGRSSLSPSTLVVSW